jgi:hypothetical protein
MDLDIQWSPPTDGFVTKIYDKRRSPDYRAIPDILTVPSAHSCLMRASKLGVIHSQLWRFRLLCTTREAWVEAAVDFCTRYLEAGHDPHVLFARILRSLGKISLFYSVTRQQLRRLLVLAWRHHSLPVLPRYM